MEMRHLTIAGLAIGAMGAAAFGASPFINVDRSNMPVYSTNDIGLEAIDMVTGEIAYSNLGVTQRTNFKTTYTSMEGGFPNGWQSALGGAFFDDFAKEGAGMRTADALHNIRFGGGVDVDGGIAFFDFFDTDANFVDGFGVQLPQGGAFIWTITLKAAIDAGDPILKTDAGFMQMAAGENNRVIWFESGAAPTLGSNMGNPGAGTAAFDTTVFAFELNNVPTPGAIALFGLAGLASARRRRA